MLKVLTSLIFLLPFYTIQTQNISTEKIEILEQNNTNPNLKKTKITDEIEEDTEEEVTPTTEPKTDSLKTEYDLEIPVIGAIHLIGTVDLTNQKFHLKSSFEKSVNLGFIKIENIVATLSNTSGLQIDADVSLFQATAKLALERFNIAEKEIEFSLTLSKPINIPISPWKFIPLQKFNLLLAKDKKELSTTTILFDQEVATISFNLDKQKNYAKLQLNTFKLSYLTKLLKNTPLDALTFEDVSIKVGNIFTKDASHPVTIIGSLELFNLNVTTNLTIDKDPRTKKPLIDFKGIIKTQKPIQPFAQIPGIGKLPGVKDITIYDVGIGMSSDQKFTIEGTSTILNFSTNVSVIKTNEGVILKASPPPGWKISQAFPILEGSLFEELDLSDIQIIISSTSYYDKELKAKIKKGFSVKSAVRVFNAQESFENTKIMLKDVPDQPLMLTGSIGKTLKETVLTVKIPTNIKLSKTSSLENINLEINGDGPTVALLSQMRVKPTEKDTQELLFTGRTEISINPLKPYATFAGTMEGTWDKPLGIKNFSLSNLALEMAIKVAPPTPLPSGFGITGIMQLGKHEVGMATKLSADGEIILRGSLNELSLTDLLSVANKFGLKIKLEDVPMLKLSDVEIYLAPEPGNIGEILFDKGLTIKGILDIFKEQATIYLTVDSTGIVAKGNVTDLQIGPLNVSGAGPDKEKGTEDDGPSINLTLTPQEQLFYISGLINLLGLETQADIHITPHKIFFETSGKFFKQFDLRFKGESSGSIKDTKTLDFKVHGKLEKTTEFSLNKEDLKQGIIDIDLEIEKIEKEFKEKAEAIEEKIEIREAELKERSKIYKGLVETFEAAQKKFQDLQEEVKKIDAEIAELEKTLAFVFPYDFSLELEKDINSRIYLSLNQQEILSRLNNIQEFLAFYQNTNNLLLAGWLGNLWEKTKETTHKASETVKQISEKTTEKVKEIDQQAKEEATKMTKDPTTYTRLKKLQTERLAKLTLLKAAETAFKAAEEAVKSFDPKTAQWRTEQGMILAELGPRKLGFELVKKLLKIAINTYPAVKIVTLGISIKKLSIEAGLNDFLHKGALPRIICQARIFDKFDIEFDFHASLKELPTMIKSMAIKSLEKVKGQLAKLLDK
jgi:hypothetical protein